MIEWNRYLGMVGVNLPRIPTPRNTPYAINLENGYLSEDPLRQHSLDNSIHSSSSSSDFERHMGHAVASGAGVSNSFSALPSVESFRHTNLVDQESSCAKMPGLVSKQLQVCEGHPNAMYAVSEGAKRGIHECQKQFKNERWNCTTEGDESVFGHTLQRGQFYYYYYYFVSKHFRFFLIFSFHFIQNRILLNSDLISFKMFSLFSIYF